MRVCLVISSDIAPAAVLADKVRGFHPEAEVVGVWAGDPQLRPITPDTFGWVDLALDEPIGVGWNRLVVALDPESYALARSCRAAALLLKGSGTPVVLLQVGSVALLEPVPELFPRSGVSVVTRGARPMPNDGLAPDIGDFIATGQFGVAAIGFAPDTVEIVEALADNLVLGGAGVHAGGVFDRTLAEHRASTSVVPKTLMAGWQEWSTSPALVDVASLDRSEPWHAAFGGREARWNVSDVAEGVGWIETTASQWRADLMPLRLPGGIEVDRPIRNLMAEAVQAWRRGDGELPPDPFGPEPIGFIEWLETPWPPWGPDVGRYWSEVRRGRPDLIGTFPRPEGVDYDAFVRWIENSWSSDGMPPLLRSGANAMRPTWSDGGHESGGVNLVGYLGFDKSLGDVARRIHRSLEDASVPNAALHYHRSGSPISAEAPALTDELLYDTNLIVINADQMALVGADHGDVLFAGRYTIAYWFWELSYIPPTMLEAVGLVDEIWVATEFTAEAFRAVTDKTVRTVHIPVPEPQSSGATRVELNVPEHCFMFLVTLDHLSVTERKNPVASVEAFKLAFPDVVEGGPILVVKTLNKTHRWVEHERVKAAAAGRSDIIVFDKHFSRPDQMALIKAADCLVSLHRAEGLGLHLMEAMWLETPCIATRYSGNLHFMNDTNSALVDAQLVDVGRGEGYFPEQGQWAEPDVDQAADLMRQMVSDAEWCAQLAEAGLSSMQSQPTLADTGNTIARWVREAHVKRGP